MKNLMENCFVRRFLACLLIISFLITGIQFPQRSVAAAAEAPVPVIVTKEPGITSLAMDPAPPAPMNTLPAGSEIQFGGYQWLLLNPAEGLMITKEAYGASRLFDTAVSEPQVNEYFDIYTPSNVGFVLENSFLADLAAQDQQWIKFNTWDWGNGGGIGIGGTVKVSLLNIYKVMDYDSILRSNPISGGWWTATWHNDGSQGNWYVDSNGDLQIETNYSSPHYVRPAIYMIPDVLVQEGVVLTTPQSDILSFTVPGQTKPANISSSVDSNDVLFPVPNTVTSMEAAPVITVSAGATISPASGASQDFSVPVTYTVTSLDGVSKTWNVMRKTESTFTGIHEFLVYDGSDSIPDINAEKDDDNHTIRFYVPEEMDASALRPTFGLPPGGSASPVSGTSRNFELSPSYAYTVTAEAGNTQDWTITCVQLSSLRNYQVEHYRQEIIGDGYELVDPPVTLSANKGTTVTATALNETGFTENTSHADRIASGTVPDTGTLVLKLYYDRDTYSLQYEENDGSIVDDMSNIRYGSVFSPPLDPTREDYIFEGWYTDIALTQEYSFSNPVTQSRTLYAKWRYDYSDVIYRMPNGLQILKENYKNGTVFGRPADPVKSGYTLMGWYLEPELVTPYNYNLPLTNDMSLYASYKQSGRDILAFHVPGQVGVAELDPVQHNIVFHMPYGSSANGLVPAITISSGATISPEGGTAKDFISPVTYTVTSESNEQQQWTATCVVDFNSQNAITGFTVPGQVGETWIDPLTDWIMFDVPYGTDLSVLTPGVTVSAGATVSPASQSTVAFSIYEPKVYRVTAQSGSVKEWKVRVNVLPNTQNGITSLTVPDQMGSSQINSENHTIVFQMPYGVDISALRPVITLNDRATSQPASSQAVDLRQPVQYTVTAENGSEQVWTVSCIQKNTANDITAFTVPNQYGNTSIDTSNHTIYFEVKQGTSVTALSPTITISTNADIYPDSGAVRDFSGSVTYLVTAQDGSPQVWTVSHGIHYEPVIMLPTVEEKKEEEDKPETTQEKLEEAVSDTKTELVVVSTGTAAVTGPGSATLTGTIVKGGGSQLQTGFRYRAATEERWSYTAGQSSTLANGQSFTAELKGLKPGTSYLFEARASNSNGLSNGGSSSFTTQKTELPVVVTNSATTRALAGMLMTGTVLKDGGDAILDTGFLWGASADALQKVSLGKGKELSHELKKLIIGKTYYYQAYAVNSAGTALGSLVKYTVPGLAVTTLEAIEIKEETATLQGKISGSDKIVECGFTISPGKQGAISAKADEKGYFKVQVEDLIPGKTYYFIAYAKTEDKTYYGKSQKLKPLDTFPKVDTTQEIKVGQIWAQFTGSIQPVDEDEDETGSGDKLSGNSVENENADGTTEENPILECGFYWGEDMETGMQVIIVKEGKIKDFTHKLVGLQAGTTYYYKAYAKNKKGTGYGETISFTTAEPTKPIVSTGSAGYDRSRDQWILSGAVTDKGGVPLTEYGFMITSDRTTWTELAVGIDTAGNFVAKDLPFLSQLEPGTYYVKAYALNKVGTGEGIPLPIVVPTLPTVEVIKDQGIPTVGTYLLKGRITGTGGDGILCDTTRFKYRKKGDKEWVTVGEVNGDFGAVDFGFTLTNLTLGAAYEYTAEAVNFKGTSSSQITEFTADYGIDALQAAEYLVKTGAKPQEIANILKDKFTYNLEETAKLLLLCGYQDEVIGAAIKASNYKPSYKDAALINKKLNFSAMTSAQILKNNYSMFDFGGDTVKSLAKVLQDNQYSIEDIAKVITNLYSYDLSGLLSLLRSAYMYSDVEAYTGVISTFGQETVMDYLWAQSLENKRQNWWLKDDQLQRELIIKLRDYCKMDSDAVMDQLMKRYPQLTLESAAKLFADTKYPIDKTIIALKNSFGAEDDKLAKALNDAGFGKEDIIRYLILEAKFTAVQIVPVLTSVVRWKDPKEACTQVLRDYYNLDAVGAAKAMYAGGWDETGDDRTGYGIGDLLSAMEWNYNQRSDYSKMLILKEIGQSPLAIALRLGGPANWVKDYKAAGFTASDVALWYRESPDEKKYGLSSQLRRFVQFSSGAGYELLDIALALRTIFNLDMDTSLKYLKDYSGKSTKLINEALKTAYGDNPLLKALLAMSGKPVKQVVKALKSTYNISSPEEAVGYLLEAGYSSKTILEGMCGNYYECRNTAGFNDFLNFAEKALPDSTFAEALNAVIYQYGNVPQPYSVISTLKRFGYDFKTTGVILKEEYHYSLHDALGGMLDNYGRVREAECTAAVLSAYQMNSATYVEYEKLRGTSAAQCAEQIIRSLGVKEASEVAELLAKGGYGKEEVSKTLLQKFFNNSLTSETAEQIDRILNTVYQDNVDTKVRQLLNNGQLKPVSQAIKVLLQAGYGLEVVIKALKELYSLTDAQIINELTAKQLFGTDEVSIALQGALSNNYLTMLINEWKGEVSAESIFGRLRNEVGIKDSAAIFRYLRYAGFSEREVIAAAYSYLWDDIIPVIKSVYNCQSAVELSELLAPYYKEEIIYIGTVRYAYQLRAVFPGITTYDIVKAFKAFGFLPNIATDSIDGWLRSYDKDGKHDDRLASILGKNNDGLGISTMIAVEILKGKGYVVQDAVYWLLQCGYTWEEFYTLLVAYYGTYTHSDNYYENHSTSKSIVIYLKDYYDVRDIARGEYSYWNHSGGVLADLISGGYTLEQSVYATLWLGKEPATDLVIGLVDNSIARANASHSQSLRLDAVAAASMVYDVSLAVAYDKKVAGLGETNMVSLLDIATCLVKHGPANRYGGSFSDKEVLSAMEVVVAKYNDISKLGLPVREMALMTLRLAGASASDGAAMLAAHRVGLSTTSILKSTFGLGNDWFEAVKLLAGAGYSYSDAISAVYNNSSYKTIIGVGILSTITSSAIGTLSSSTQLSAYIKIGKEAAKLGFKIGEGTITLDDVMKYNLGYLQYKYGKMIYDYVPGDYKP